MKTILIISYHYFPEEGSCSEKNDRIVRNFLDNGYKVIVITKGYLDYPEIIDNDKCTIIRTKSNGIFHKVKGNLPKKCNESTLNFKRKISNSIIPDSVIDWFPSVKKLVIKYMKMIKSCDCVFSISSPYSSHIISKWISKKIHKPLVLCYGDPWLYEGKRKKNKCRYLIEKQLEKSVIKYSDKILLITEINKEKYMKLYDINADKILTYNIGYDNIVCKKFFDSLPRANNKLKIIYGGSLDKVHRDPIPFLDAIKKIDFFEVNIYNNDNNEIKQVIAKNNLEQRVKLQELVPTDEFYKKMNEADILLLFGNKTPYQVPGKLFTYISSKKIILYIKNNNFENDGTEAILRDYKNSIIVDNNIREIYKGLQQILKRTDEFSTNICIDKFEFHNTMKSIINAVEEVCKKEKGENEKRKLY